MDGHFHSGIADAVHTALLFLLILAVWRTVTLVLITAKRGPLQTAGKALAWIVN